MFGFPALTVGNGIDAVAVIIVKILKYAVFKGLPDNPAIVIVFIGQIGIDNIKIPLIAVLHSSADLDDFFCGGR